MTKREVARTLKAISFFLRLKDDNPYKARAYEQAGEALLLCPRELCQLVNSATLTEVKGIGPATAAVITELVSTGVSDPSIRTRVLSVLTRRAGRGPRIKHETNPPAL